MIHQVSKIREDENGNPVVVMRYSIHRNDANGKYIHDISEETQKVYDAHTAPYTYIKNPYAAEHNLSNPIDIKLCETFYNCIGDAIRSVREGYAHGLMGSNHSTQLRPIFILDNPEKAEEIRMKTIAGWEGVEFGYAILFSSNSGRLAEKLNEHGDILKFTWPAVYDTKADAEAKIQTYIDMAENILKKINFSDDAEIVAEKLGAATSQPNVPFIVAHLAYEMISENGMSYDRDNWRKTFNLETIQYMKGKKQ